MEFHEKLQNLRRQRGLTQEELAQALYVSRTAVSKWESGRGFPNIDSLKAIAAFFSVSVDELLSGDALLTMAEAEGRQAGEPYPRPCAGAAGLRHEPAAVSPPVWAAKRRNRAGGFSVLPDCRAAVSENGFFGGSHFAGAAGHSVAGAAKRRLRAVAHLSGQALAGAERCRCGAFLWPPSNPMRRYLRWRCCSSRRFCLSSGRDTRRVVPVTFRFLPPPPLWATLCIGRKPLYDQRNGAQ